MDNQIQATGDLTSLPGPGDWNRIEEVVTMEKVIELAPLPDRPQLRRQVRERISRLEAELAVIGPGTRAALLRLMGGQFRLRLDLGREKLACEQWLPALRCWLVNGYYPLDRSATSIAHDLKAHDPRRPENDGLLQLSQRRAEAARIRAANEAAGDAKVQAAIDALGDRGVRQFVEVETALRSGDQITLRGSDANTMQRLVDQTKVAATNGDLAAQAALNR